MLWQDAKKADANKGEFSWFKLLVKVSKKKIKQHFKPLKIVFFHENALKLQVLQDVLATTVASRNTHYSHTRPLAFHWKNSSTVFTFKEAELTSSIFYDKLSRISVLNWFFRFYLTYTFEILIQPPRYKYLILLKFTNINIQ